MTIFSPLYADDLQFWFFVATTSPDSYRDELISTLLFFVDLTSQLSNFFENDFNLL
jgi:hypothetical protein